MNFRKRLMPVGPKAGKKHTVYGLKKYSVLNSSYRMFLRFTSLKPCCS